MWRKKFHRIFIAQKISKASFYVWKQIRSYLQRFLMLSSLQHNNITCNVNFFRKMWSWGIREKSFRLAIMNDV